MSPSARPSRRRARWPLAAALGLLWVAGAAQAFLIQTQRVSGRIVQTRWSVDTVPVRFDAAGSDDLGPARTLDILRAGFDTWARVPGARIAFREEGVFPDLAASRRDGRNTILFDETGEVVGAPSSSGIIAVTRINADLRDGTILDADIVFNGRDFRFSAEPRSGHILLSDVAVHEIGHLLGLEHSPLGGAAGERPTMNPFYFGDGPGEATSLAPDDSAGVRVLYPDFDAPAGVVAGRVRDLAGGEIFGAHVIAEDIATGHRYSTLSGAESGDGAYVLRGLPPGTYRIALEPVSGSVDEDNFNGLFEGFAAGFPAEWFDNVESPLRATTVRIDRGGPPVRAVDFTTGFVNPGEPFVVDLEPPANTPDTDGPYPLRFDVLSAERAWLVTDVGGLVRREPLERTAATRFEGRIPGQVAGTRVRYRVEAESADGVTASLPRDGGWLDFEVLELSGAPLAFAVLREESALGVYDTATEREVARVELGGDPIQLLSSRAGDRLFVSDLETATVHVIETASFRRVARIDVDAQPLDMALSPDGATLYVSNSGAARWTAIDVGTGAVTASVPVGLFGDGPYGIAAAGGGLYLTDINADAVLGLDGDGQLRRRIEVAGGPRSLALDRGRGRLLVTSFRAGLLTVIDTATDEVAAVVDLPIEGGFAVAVDPAGARAYVSGHADAALVAVDLESLRVVGRVQVGLDPRGIAFSPDGTQIYVSTAASGELHVIDAATLSRQHVVAAPGGPRGLHVQRLAGAPGTAVTDAAVPGAWNLSRAWPNPFNPETQLTLDLPRAGGVRLTVYDVLGRRLRGIDLGRLAAGRHVLRWDGRDDAGRAVASGVYVLSVDVAAHGATTRKVLLLR